MQRPWQYSAARQLHAFKQVLVSVWIHVTDSCPLTNLEFQADTVRLLYW